MPYAILNSDGQLQDALPTLDDAVEEAFEDFGAEHVVIDAAGDPESMLEANPRTPMYEKAVSRLKLAPREASLFISDSAISMPLKEAHERLRPLFPPFYEGGKKLDPASRESANFAFTFIGKNAKLEKREGSAENVWVEGVALLPYFLYAKEVLGKEINKAGGQWPNLCVGSSEACRHSCLVFAGQNWASSYSSYSKGVRTTALFEQPEAYGRMLYEACRKHQIRAEKAGYIPMIRLNVLSDIPWEHVFPSLFEALPALQFYDYTKVADRQNWSGFPDNYDLTFSLSGPNMSLVSQALEEGQRIAAVIHIPEWEQGAASKGTGGKAALGEEKYTKLQKEAKERLWSSRLPKKCNGFRVIDGDVNDVRALDPAPAIVALRWKAPGGQSGKSEGMTTKQKAEKAKMLSKKTKFIVEVHEFCGMVASAVTPSEQPDTCDIGEGIPEALTKRSIGITKRSNNPQQAAVLRARMARMLK
jgi:hypothetical protein